MYSLLRERTRLPSRRATSTPVVAPYQSSGYELTRYTAAKPAKPSRSVRTQIQRSGTVGSRQQARRRQRIEASRSGFRRGGHGPSRTRPRRSSAAEPEASGTNRSRSHRERIMGVRSPRVPTRAATATKNRSRGELKVDSDVRLLDHCPIVRGHEHGGAPPRAPAPRGDVTFRALASSSRDVGSSATRTVGRAANPRAMRRAIARRGTAAPLVARPAPARPTASSEASASARPLSKAQRGSTFSRALRNPISGRLATKPTCSARTLARAVRSSCVSLFDELDGATDPRLEPRRDREHRGLARAGGPGDDREDPRRTSASSP